MFRTRSRLLLLAAALLAGSCISARPAEPQSAQERLSKARIAVVPFSYRNYLPFEHDSGVRLARAVEAQLATRIPASASIVAAAPAESYLRSTEPPDLDLDRLAGILQADLLILGNIRLLDWRENPPPGSYAGLGVFTVEMFDRSADTTVLTERVIVRVEDLDGTPAARGASFRDVRREVLNEAARRIAELLVP